MSKCELCGEPMPPGEEVFKFHGYSGPCPKPPLPKPETEVDRLRKVSARYDWLVSKVFARGETCLALFEEFGGAPFKGETIRQFMDRYIDEALTANAELWGAPPTGGASHTNAVLGAAVPPEPTFEGSTKDEH